MHSKFYIFLSSLVLATSLMAKADILFIDFNLSEKEIAAAQSAANIRGEKLVVFPEVSPEIRKYVGDIELYQRQITQNLKKCPFDNACINRNLARYTQSMDAVTAVLSKIQFNVDVLTQFFEQMDRERRSFSAFIESGHAGAEQFSGYFKAISHADLAKAVEGKSSLQTVKTVLYWGCYTMSIEAVKNRWPKIFPSAHLIAGFDQVGPSGEQKSSAALLEQTLLTEDQAIATGTNLSALIVYFKKMPYSKDTNFALSVDYNTYVSNHNSLMMADATKICSSKTYAIHAAVIKCYADANSAACASPPADTAAGDLRKSYTVIQGMEHCFGTSSELLSPSDRIDPEFALRLLFFKNVAANFARLHRNDLLSFDSELVNSDVSSDHYLSNLANLSRAEIVKKIKFLVGIADNLKPKMKEKITSLEQSLVLLSSKSIPQPWIEPDSREDIPVSYDLFKMQ